MVCYRVSYRFSPKPPTAVIIQVSQGPYTYPEGNTVFVSVLASNPAGRTVTVNVAGVDDTAVGEYMTLHVPYLPPSPDHQVAWTLMCQWNCS